MFDNLYDWAPVGSFLAVDFDGDALVQYPKLSELLESIGANLYMRNPTTFTPLLGRWRLTKHGILPIEEWEAEVSSNSVERNEPVLLYDGVVYK